VADTAASSPEPSVITASPPVVTTQLTRISKQAETRAGLKSASVVIAASVLRVERRRALSNDVWRIHEMHWRSNMTAWLSGLSTWGEHTQQSQLDVL